MQSSRWCHGCFTCENILTRRANQRHYSIIAQFPRPPIARNGITANCVASAAQARRAQCRMSATRRKDELFAVAVCSARTSSATSYPGSDVRYGRPRVAQGSPKQTRKCSAPVWWLPTRPARPSQWRSDALAGGHPDDESDRRHRQAARHIRERPHHSRQERACEFERTAADLTVATNRSRTFSRDCSLRLATRASSCQAPHQKARQNGLRVQGFARPRAPLQERSPAVQQRAVKGKQT